MRYETIENNFRYHPPSDEQVAVYHDLREEGKKLALHIERECPESREKAIAFTKLEEAVMWANAAIGRNT